MNDQYFRKAASDPLPKEHYLNQIIDARHRFMKRRNNHEFKWDPCRKVRAPIFAYILGSESGQQNRKKHSLS
jgi:hypothetical protein